MCNEQVICVFYQIMPFYLDVFQEIVGDISSMLLAKRMFAGGSLLPKVDHDHARYWLELSMYSFDVCLRGVQSIPTFASAREFLLLKLTYLIQAIRIIYEQSATNCAIDYYFMCLVSLFFFDCDSPKKSSIFVVLYKKVLRMLWMLLH